MRLVARSPSCFSNQYVLKLDSRPVGHFQSKWLSEGIDIRLTERLQLHFEKTSWLGSNFQLIDAIFEQNPCTRQSKRLFVEKLGFEPQHRPGNTGSDESFFYRHFCPAEWKECGERFSHWLVRGRLASRRRRLARRNRSRLRRAGLSHDPTTAEE